MKKIALTSLVAVFAASGAMAANVIDGNPLYRPGEGHFYSETTLVSDNKHANVFTLGEEFGYGVTDHFYIALATTASESDWFRMNQWNNLGVKANWRVLDEGNWKGDIFGQYGMTGIRLTHTDWFDKDFTFYQWTAGAMFGYDAYGWALAGHVAFDYQNTESFNWGDEGSHILRAGVDTQLRLSKYWNLVAGAEYYAHVSSESDWAENNGFWTAKFGANLNIDSTKYVGAFIGKEMKHASAGDWEIEDGFAFGATFGIDF